MRGPATIEIGELLIPGATEADGIATARATQRELGELYRDDVSRGRQWRDDVPAIALELDSGMSPDVLGRALARAIRERLLSHEQAQ